ncbi:MAG: hypothetical protein H5T64_01700 [Chloroflexi bacterium]|nr:hypothetical protein [Chloroflexota bacterium]
MTGENNVMYCANHPDIETLLRCSKCGKPICTRCGIRTPVGVRCRECANLQRSPMYIVGPSDLLRATVVALPCSLLAGFVMSQVNLLFGFFIGPVAGGSIAELVSRITHGKRGVEIQILVSACIILGALVPALYLTGVLFNRSALTGSRLFALVYRVNVVYLVLSVGAAIARLR